MAEVSEILNLRRARKAKARHEGEKEADANRVRFGTPKNMRDLSVAEARKRIAALEAHRLEKPKDRKD